VEQVISLWLRPPEPGHWAGKQPVGRWPPGVSACFLALALASALRFYPLSHYEDVYLLLKAVYPFIFFFFLFFCLIAVITIGLVQC